MKKLYSLPSLAAAVCLLACALPTRGDFPEPSPFPVSWELTLTYQKPKRIVVQAPGDSNPFAYWYVTYHVVNNTDRDKVIFYPTIEMETQGGDLIRSDNGVKPAVFDAIKKHEGLKYLMNANQIGGELRHGEDESRDGVAIWPEPALQMGTFSVYLTGFWGETKTIKVGDKDVTLHKTLQLTYHLNSDASHPGEGQLIDKGSEYIMR